MKTEDRVAAKKSEFVAMFESGLAGARADNDPHAQDFYRGALAALKGRPPIPQRFLMRNATACVRGGTYNDGHMEGRTYLHQLMVLEAVSSSADTLRPTGDE